MTQALACRGPPRDGAAATASPVPEWCHRRPSTPQRRPHGASVRCAPPLPRRSDLLRAPVLPPAAAAAPRRHGSAPQNCVPDVHRHRLAAAAAAARPPLCTSPPLCMPALYASEHSTSTPDGGTQFIMAVTVSADRFLRSTSRLCVRTSKCSRASLLTWGERRTQ